MGFADTLHKSFRRLVFLSVFYAASDFELWK